MGKGMWGGWKSEGGCGRGFGALELEQRTYLLLLIILIVPAAYSTLSYWLLVLLHHAGGGLPTTEAPC